MGSDNTVFDVLDKVAQSPNLRNIRYVVEEGDKEYYAEQYGSYMVEEVEIYDGYFTYPKAHGVEMRQELSADGMLVPNTFMEVWESTITWKDMYCNGTVTQGKKHFAFMDKAPCTVEEYNRSVFKDEIKYVPLSHYDQPPVCDPDVSSAPFIEDQVSTCEDISLLNKVCFPNGYHEGWYLDSSSEFIEGKLGRNIQAKVNNIVHQAAKVYEEWLSEVSEDDYSVIKQVEFDEDGGSERSTILQFKDADVVNTNWGLGKSEPRGPDAISYVSITDEGEDGKTDGFYGEYGDSYNSRMEIDIRSAHTVGILSLFDGYWKDAEPTSVQCFTPDHPSKVLVHKGSRFEKGDPLFEYEIKSGETVLIRAEYDGKVTYRSDDDGGRWMLEFEVEKPEPWYSGILSFFSPEKPEKEDMTQAELLKAIKELNQNTKRLKDDNEGGSIIGGSFMY